MTSRSVSVEFDIEFGVDEDVVVDRAMAVYAGGVKAMFLDLDESLVRFKVDSEDLERVLEKFLSIADGMRLKWEDEGED